ncbi:MAG: Metal-sensitive transcriptional repressor [Candidatus Parcubacteria bacterium]|jgi:DNA-binding FrmR family transcriptional regulator
MSKKLMENRLRRLEGQVAGLREKICADASCETVVPQFLAVKGAFNAAFEAYVKETLADCAAKDTKKRDQLISMLIKK